MAARCLSIAGSELTFPTDLFHHTWRAFYFHREGDVPGTLPFINIQTPTARGIGDNSCEKLCWFIAEL